MDLDAAGRPPRRWCQQVGFCGWLALLQAAPAVLEASRAAPLAAPPLPAPAVVAPASPAAPPPPAPEPPLPAVPQPAVPQVARDGWKDCSYNDLTIPCRDEQRPGGLRIIWKDGARMTYRERPPAPPGAPVDLEDRYGGLWRREVLVQGNTLLVNRRHGNRILVPLRFVCRAPLRGEVGYCRP
jgi:hypothetical protein